MSLQTGCQEWGCNSYITRRLLSNSDGRSKKFPRRVPSSRDFSLKKSHNSPGTRSPARGSQQALSVAIISMSFDVLPFGADALGLCIADVAGKGLSAALLMSNLQALVRGLAAPSLPPDELCLRLNVLLHRNMEGDRFVTFFYAQLDGPARRLSYVNAGHNPPFVLHRDGTHHRLKEGGGVTCNLAIASFFSPMA